MIRTVDIARTFETADGPVRAVDEISVTLPDKGMVFIIGKSGSGKSTFLNLLAGYDSATYGNIFVDDRDITKFSQQELSDYQFKKLGFVFQNYSLIESISVYLNISLGSKISFKKQRKEIDKVLKDVGLKNYGKRKVTKLSGGEKQRVALARAIIKKPQIILCDEPCGNLDAVNSKMVLDILKKQSRKALVVVVSHNLNDAYTYADRVLTLEKGELIEDKIFNKKLTRQKNIKYITDFNALSEEEIEEINVGLSQGEISYIFRRKDFFIDNDYDTSIIEENEEKEEPPEPHFVPQIIRILNKNFFKVGVFALLIGLALALFSICYSIESFNGDRFFDTAFENYNYNFVSYNKGIIGEEDSDYSTTFYDEIVDADRELIKESGYEGNAYELYNISLYTLSYETTTILHKIPRRQFVEASNFSNFYSRETEGVLVTNEEFIKSHLKLDTLNIAWASNVVDSGILITDYVADSFVINRNTSYPNRNSVLGNYTDPVFYNSVYINGIIDTNYETDFEELRKSLASNTSNYTMLLDEENLETFEYMKNCLNIAYSTNPDFLTAYKEYNHIAPKHGLRYQLKDNSIFSMSTVGVASCTALPDNTIMISMDTLRSTYPNMTAAQMQEEINKGNNEKIKVSLVEWNSQSAAELDYEWESMEFDNIIVYDPDVHDDYYNSTNCANMNRKTYVSPNLLSQLINETFYSYSFFMDDIENAIALKNVLIGNSLYPNNEIYTAAMDLTDIIKTFDSIFILLTVASAAVVALIVGYYGVNLVSGNKYNIGVLKALGYRGIELTLYYLITLLIFFGLVTIFYVSFYRLFLSIVNDVLVDSLVMYVSQKATYFTKFGIFAFSPTMIFSVLTVFLGVLGIITITYLLILRKFRAIKILQDKD